MLIKKSQAILKRFMGSENETMFCDTTNFFQVDRRSRFSKH